MTLEQRIEALEKRVAELEAKQFSQAEYEAKLDALADITAPDVLATRWNPGNR
jgi:BMFP domain-containing protein YqiC